MKQLYICEKPSQARDVAKVLGATKRQEGALSGNDVVVTWCIGHLLEMSPPDEYGAHLKKWTLEALPILPQEWLLEVKSGVSKQFKVIKKLLTQCDEVVIGTDADREGTCIGNEVLDFCGYRGPTKRLWLTALDESCIRKALSNLLPGESMQPLYEAGLARARADWLVGMNLTRAFTLSGRDAGYDVFFPYGRVQTPVLRLVVDRDREIDNFKPVNYVDVFIDVVTEGKGTFYAKWLPQESVKSVACDEAGHCLDEDEARGLVQALTGAVASVDVLEHREEQVPPPLGYDLSTLQEEASARWGFSADQTLGVAQSLYEKHKVTTYPRSDCGYLPESQFDEARLVLLAVKKAAPDLWRFIEGADVFLKSDTWNQKKVEENSHHGIMPTVQACDPDAFSEEERVIYDLICRRYIAQFFPDYVYTATKIGLKSQGEMFEVRGRNTRVKGWKCVAKEEALPKGCYADKVFLNVKEGESLRVSEARLKERKTKPPSHYTEGTLIKAMKSVGKIVDDPALKKILRETSGLGQVATRAAIIKTLLQRKLLMTRGKKKLQASELGKVLIDALPHEAKDPAMTALWEQSLDDIAKGRTTMAAFLDSQVSWITSMLSLVDKNSIVFEGAQVYPCAECQKPMRLVKDFWGCTGYPACRYTLPDDNGKPGKPRKKTSSSAQRKVYCQVAVGCSCPECEMGVVEKCKFKKGQNRGKPFYGCSNRHCHFFQWCQ